MLFLKILFSLPNSDLPTNMRGLVFSSWSRRPVYTVADEQRFLPQLPAAPGRAAWEVPPRQPGLHEPGPSWPHSDTSPCLLGRTSMEENEQGLHQFLRVHTLLPSRRHSGGVTCNLEYTEAHSCCLAGVREGSCQQSSAMATSAS